MYILEKSNRKNKKYMITTPEGKKIHFGDNRYQDFTMHKNEERKQLYINRHQVRENWTDKNTAGFWSRWLLWNQPTITESIVDIEKRFKITIV